MAYPRLSREALVLALLASVGCSSKSREYDEGSGGNTGNNTNRGGQNQGGGGASAAGGTPVNHAGNSAHSGTTASSAGATSTGGTPATAGTSATGGTATDARNTSTAGGSTMGGTAAATGGATATGGKAAAGATAVGGMTSTGGTNSTGGATTTGACSTAADCRNPDPYTCTASCMASVCKLAVSSPLAPAGATYTSIAAPTDGFWDANNAPYVVYAPYADSMNPPSLLIQRVKADGTNSGGATTLLIPTDLAQPTELAAAISGTELGLLFGALQNPSAPYPNSTTQFVRTDAAATAATPVAVSVSSHNGPVWAEPYALFLSPNGPGNWTMAHFAGNGSTYWAGYSGPVSTATTFAMLTSSPLSGYAAMVLLDDTVLVSGLSCTNYRTGICSAPDLLIARYTASDLSALGAATTIATVPYMSSGGATPAMAKLGTKVALLWTDQTTTGDLLMGSAIVNKDGTISRAAARTASNLIPKALVAAPDGSALLVANRKDSASSFTPVVQKMSAALQPVGSAYAIASASATDTMRDVSAKNSTDGRTLITYRIDGSPYRRIVHTNLCQ